MVKTRTSAEAPAKQGARRRNRDKGDAASREITDRFGGVTAHPTASAHFPVAQFDGGAPDVWASARDCDEMTGECHGSPR
ncbi:dihydropyrimidine dehydrogenase [Rhodobacterales bacterium HTCC2654]|uniref:Dihydropyrimidine dehydrogenase n=1 Tax=Maritimibacter alkaliphilus HTCC2654 TaxID=314271 RepID=A3VH42_9RHOB|nr:dihydropyrimidine dehydrogenase [Rhodobacterales bacterium HTCC2654] [Maritimibacter alkaliphilus HTCC2654]